MPTLEKGEVKTEGYAEAVYADGGLHASSRSPAKRIGGSRRCRADLTGRNDKKDKLIRQ